MANVNSISVSPPAASNTLFGFIGLLIMKLILSTAYVKLVNATNIVNYLQSKWRLVEFVLEVTFNIFVT
jgi:hypothetical protein